jgi:tetratricopeptide (TPR) repeat protein
MSYYNDARMAALKSMSDNDTSSAKVVSSKVNQFGRKFSPLTVTFFAAIILIVVLLISKFTIDRLNTDKVKSALVSAKQANNVDQPNTALAQLASISSIKLTTADQENVLIDKMTAYSLLSEYSNALASGEQASSLMPNDLSLLLTTAQLAQMNQETQTAINYYKKAITIIGTTPENKQGLTYKSDLENLQIQLKALEQ